MRTVSLKRHMKKLHKRECISTNEEREEELTDYFTLCNFTQGYFNNFPLPNYSRGGKVLLQSIGILLVSIQK